MAWQAPRTPPAPSQSCLPIASFRSQQAVYRSVPPASVCSGGPLQRSDAAGVFSWSFAPVVLPPSGSPVHSSVSKGFAAIASPRTFSSSLAMVGSPRRMNYGAASRSVSQPPQTPQFVAMSVARNRLQRSLGEVMERQSCKLDASFDELGAALHQLVQAHVSREVERCLLVVRSSGKGDICSAQTGSTVTPKLVTGADVSDASQKELTVNACKLEESRDQQGSINGVCAQTSNEGAQEAIVARVRRIETQLREDAHKLHAYMADFEATRMGDSHAECSALRNRLNSQHTFTTQGVRPAELSLVGARLDCAERTLLNISKRLDMLDTVHPIEKMSDGAVVDSGLDKQESPEKGCLIDTTMSLISKLQSDVSSLQCKLDVQTSCNITLETKVRRLDYSLDRLNEKLQVEDSSDSRLGLLESAFSLLGDMSGFRARLDALGVGPSRFAQLEDEIERLREAVERDKRYELACADFQKAIVTRVVILERSLQRAGDISGISAKLEAVDAQISRPAPVQDVMVRLNEAFELSQRSEQVAAEFRKSVLERLAAVESGLSSSGEGSGIEQKALVERVDNLERLSEARGDLSGMNMRLKAMDSHLVGFESDIRSLLRDQEVRLKSLESFFLGRASIVSKANFAEFQGALRSSVARQDSADCDFLGPKPLMQMRGVSGSRSVRRRSSSPRLRRHSIAERPAVAELSPVSRLRTAIAERIEAESVALLGASVDRLSIEGKIDEVGAQVLKFEKQLQDLSRSIESHVEDMLVQQQDRSSIASVASMEALRGEFESKFSSMHEESVEERRLCQRLVDDEMMKLREHIDRALSQQLARCATILENTSTQIDSQQRQRDEQASFNSSLEMRLTQLEHVSSDAHKGAIDRMGVLEATCADWRNSGFEARLDAFTRDIVELQQHHFAVQRELSTIYTRIQDVTSRSIEATEHARADIQRVMREQESYRRREEVFQEQLGHLERGQSELRLLCSKGEIPHDMIAKLRADVDAQEARQVSALEELAVSTNAWDRLEPAERSLRELIGRHDVLANALPRMMELADAQPKALRSVVKRLENLEKSVRDAGFFKSLGIDKSFASAGKDIAKLQHDLEIASHGMMVVQARIEDVMLRFNDTAERNACLEVSNADFQKMIVAQDACQRFSEMLQERLVKVECILFETTRRSGQGGPSSQGNLPGLHANVHAAMRVLVPEPLTITPDCPMAESGCGPVGDVVVARVLERVSAWEKALASAINGLEAKWDGMSSHTSRLQHDSEVFAQRLLVVEASVERAILIGNSAMLNERWEETSTKLNQLVKDFEASNRLQALVQKRLDVLEETQLLMTPSSATSDCLQPALEKLRQEIDGKAAKLQELFEQVATKAEVSSIRNQHDALGICHNSLESRVRQNESIVKLGEEQSRKLSALKTEVAMIRRDREELFTRCGALDTRCLALERSQSNVRWREGDSLLSQLQRDFLQLQRDVRSRVEYLERCWTDVQMQIEGRMEFSIQPEQRAFFDAQHAAANAAAAAAQKAAAAAASEASELDRIMNDLVLRVAGLEEARWRCACCVLCREGPNGRIGPSEDRGGRKVFYKRCVDENRMSSS